MSEINVKEKLEAIVARAMDSIDRAGDLNALNDVRVSVLGKRRADSGFKRDEGCGSGRPAQSGPDGQ